MSVFWSRADQTSRNARALSTEHLMADLGKRTASGGMIAVAAQGVKMVLQLTQAAILARLLAPEDFGIMAMAMTVTGFVSIFTDLGLSAATVQRKEIDQDTVSALFFMNIAMGLVVMAICMASAPVAAWFFGDPRVTWVVAAMAGTIPLGAATAQHNALLTRGMRWFTIQWTAIVVQCLGLCISVILAWQTQLGFWALVISSWVTGIVGVAVIWSVCAWRPSRVTNWAGARSSVNFGAYLTGFNLVNYFHRQFDNVLVGWRWGPSELGYYSRAYNLFMLPLTAVVWPMGSSVISAMSRVQNDPERLRTIYGRALSFVLWAGSLAGTVSYVYAEPLVRLLYGAGWIGAIPIFKALSLSILIQPIYSSVGWIALALGETKRQFYGGLASALIYAAAFRMGVEFGAVGVAYAYCMSLIIIVPAWVVYITRGTPISAAMILRIAIGPLVTGIVSIAVVDRAIADPASLPGIVTGLCMLCALSCLGYALSTFRSPWCILQHNPIFRLK